MDGIIINELSLNGQFLDSRDFWKNAALQPSRQKESGRVNQTCWMAK